MGGSLLIKTLSIILTGIVLAGHLSPIASEMVLCIGDGAAPNCCRNSNTNHHTALGDSRPVLARSDCDCCMTVGAMPSSAGVSSHKQCLDAAAGPAHLWVVVLQPSTRVPRAVSECADTRLSALRTIVLLI